MECDSRYKKNVTNVVSVAKLCVLPVLFKEVKKLMWVKDAVNVSQVLKALTIIGIFKHTENPILKMNPMNVNNGVKHLDPVPPYNCMKELL